MNAITETPLVCIDGSVTVIDLGHDYKQIGESQLDAIRGRLLELAQTVDPPLVVIDLTGITFFGSSFIELMFRLGNRLRLRQGRLALCGLDPYCAEVLNITRVDRLWPTFADRAAAVAALQTAIPVAS
jgi:anti-anti-sigma factor